MHTLGVSGVLTNADGHVLLVRTSHAGWELPGGTVEAGEDLVAALQREVREETGCVAEPGRIVAVHLHVTRGLVHIIIDGSASGSPHVGGDDDSLDAAWFAPEAALHAVTHATEHDCLRHGLESGGAAAEYCAFD